MMNFKVGQRVEFDAKERVYTGTIVHLGFDSPSPVLETMIVKTDEDGKWSVHPKMLRLMEDNDGTSTI